jgi:Tfp pilus assembly protein PilE
VMPVIFVIGIVAAIALPAYSDYVKRAKAAQVSR